VQKKLIDMLLNKLRKAAARYNIQDVAVAGGVSANTALRQRLADEGARLGWKTYIPAFEYCTDNAAMIAMTAHFKFLSKDFVSLDAVPQPRMKFEGS
jgi:N6-L-threonylcarbamoyladenine synthase